MAQSARDVVIETQRPQPSLLTVEARWRRRPLLRVAVRLVVVLAPAAGSLAVAIAISRTWTVPPGFAGNAMWWAVLIVATLATWTVCSNLLQRILPLATLLDLTLTFPYSAPSRLAMLHRNADPKQLESELRRLRQRSDPETALRAQLILELAVALTIHDSRTGGHSERVRMFTDMVAKELHLRQSDIDRLRWAALLHDVGKLAVAPEVLNKTDFPDEAELESLRNHPIEGYRMIAPLHQWLGPWAATVHDHHEHFDGSGYPSGLRGNEISLGGRIVAVTDSYEAMTAGRPYRMPLTVRAAREELVRRSGTHFDPMVVRAFLAVSVGRLWPVVGIGALMAALPFPAKASMRVSQVGARSASAVATAGAAAALLVAGVLGPASVQLLGPSSAGPSVARNVQAATPQGSAPESVPQSSPQSTQPSSSPTSTAFSAASPSGSTTPGGNKTPLYPPGITRHATVPLGIAKNPNAFVQWRLKH